jgi:hypothetical protein
MVTYNISVNGKPVSVHQDTILEGRLKELGDVPPVEELNLVLPDGFKAIGDGEVIHLREGMKFISSVRTGHSS